MKHDNTIASPVHWTRSRTRRACRPRRARLRVTQIDRDIVLAEYERAIQIAFREVADALAGRGTIDDQLAVGP